MDNVYLDEAGIPVADFNIMDWAVFPNKTSAGVKIGNIEKEEVSSDIKFSIDENAIIWPSSFYQVIKSASLWILLFIHSYISTCLCGLSILSL